jgi:hypothetical protein
MKMQFGLGEAADERLDIVHASSLLGPMGVPDVTWN